MTAESVPGRLGVERRRPRRPQRVRDRNGAAQVDHRHQRRPLRLRRRRDEGNVLLLKIFVQFAAERSSLFFFQPFSLSRYQWKESNPGAGNTKGGSITVPLTSCLAGLDWSVLQIKTTIVSCHIADSKPVKQTKENKNMHAINM
jgi:hypothetical protein